MRRLKRCKKRNRKQFIKATMSSLVLTLVIYTIKPMTIYAYFMDKEVIRNDLVISMGKLDVEVSNGFEGEILEHGKDVKKEFTIENKGTLGQNLSIGLQVTNNIPEDILDSIKYELKLKHNGTELPAITRTIKELTQNKTIIKDIHGNEVILSPKDKLECTATIQSKLDKIIEEKLDFKLKVFAKQINYIDGGFTDLYIQKNYIQCFESADSVKDEQSKEEVQVLSELNIEDIKAEINEENKPEVLELKEKIKSEIIDMPNEKEDKK